MKIAVVGSRTLTNYNLVKSTLDKFKITEIISGGARGADSLGAAYAQSKGIPCRVCLPNWTMYGKAAEFRRNITIVQNCDQVVAFLDGISKGTAHTIQVAKELNKPWTIVRF